MDGLFRFFASRHRLANLFIILILALGQMVIMTRYPGASPEDVELNVTNKIETQLKGIAGIKGITSISLENISRIMVVIKADHHNHGRCFTRSNHANQGHKGRQGTV